MCWGLEKGSELQRYSYKKQSSRHRERRYKASGPCSMTKKLLLSRNWNIAKIQSIFRSQYLVYKFGKQDDEGNCLSLCRRDCWAMFICKCQQKMLGASWKRSFLLRAFCYLRCIECSVSRRLYAVIQETFYFVIFHGPKCLEWIVVEAFCSDIWYRVVISDKEITEMMNTDSDFEVVT